MPRITATCADWHEAEDDLQVQLMFAHFLRLRGFAHMVNANRIHRAKFKHSQVILFCRVMATGWDAANDLSARAA